MLESRPTVEKFAHEPEIAFGEKRFVETGGPLLSPEQRMQPKGYSRARCRDCGKRVRGPNHDRGHK